MSATQDVVIDLANKTVTRYVRRYNTRFVTQYRYNTVFKTRFVDVATAVVVNYLLNGSVITSLVIPTRIVLGESIVSGSPASRNEQKAWIQPKAGGGTQPSKTRKVVVV